MHDSSDTRQKMSRMLLPLIKSKGDQWPVCWGSVVTLTNEHIDISRVPGATEVVQFISNSIDDYWVQLGYRSKPVIKNVWANINPPGGMVHVHDHAPSALSGCFYINCESNAGDLYISHPDELLLRHQPYDSEQLRHNHFTFDYKVEVQPGSLVIWPGYLRHRSGVNESTTDRIIFGFDVQVSD